MAGGMHGGPRPGDPVPDYLVGQAPPRGMRIHTRSQATGSILFPIIGLILVALICPILPWIDLGSDSANLWDMANGIWDTSAEDWAGFYVGYGWFIMVAICGPISAAATLDAKGLRITIGVLSAILTIGMVLLTLGSLVFMNAAGNALSATGTGSADDGMALASGVVLVLSLFPVIGTVLLFALKGLAYRILAGVTMLGAALIHAATVASMGNDVASAEPGAYLAALGYVLCALGCFVGPRYIRVYAPAR